MKRSFSVVLTLVLVFVLSFGSIPAEAVGETTGEVDVVFLVDSSRSMERSDPDMLRLEAIKLFADLCTVGKTRIGFVLFGSDIVYSQAPEEVATEQDRAKLKETVSGLDSLGGSTDIGRALKFAAEMLAGDGHSGKGKFIVFLSDGKTVINNADGGRTLEDSEADLDSGIKTAKDEGIPIYTIGLNASGSVDEDELMKISRETYADDTYMTNDAGDLAEILSDIYIRHTGAEKAGVIADIVSEGGYSDTGFSVEADTVVEANVVMVHSAPLDDVKLYAPNGAEVPFDGTKAALLRTDGHTLVKIYYPAVGNWKLSVKSIKETSIKISLIMSMDYELALSILTDKAAAAGAKLKISASLNDLGSKPIEDMNILSGLSGRAVIVNTDTGEQYETALNADRNIFRGAFVLPTDGTYTVQASLGSDRINIRSGIFTLDAGTEAFVEPEGPLKLILICAGAGVILILILILILKKSRKTVKMWSGRITVTGNCSGMPLMTSVFDIAQKCPGKKKITLFDILREIYGEEQTDRIMPRNMSTAAVITMDRSGDLHLAAVRGIEFGGGADTDKTAVIKTGGRETLRTADAGTGMKNTVIIHYRMT